LVRSIRDVGNTGPRRFLIVEFDFDATNSAEEARLLAKLGIEGRDVRDLCAAFPDVRLRSYIPLSGVLVNSSSITSPDVSMAPSARGEEGGAGAALGRRLTRSPDPTGTSNLNKK
jgi:hypothetical protein